MNSKPQKHPPAPCPLHTVSDAVLEGMERDGWTPAQVRALVAAYRELLGVRGRALEVAWALKGREDDQRSQKLGKRLERVLLGTAQATKGRAP